jgi:hypothetical protein
VATELLPVEVPHPRPGGGRSAAGGDLVNRNLPVDAVALDVDAGRFLSFLLESFIRAAPIDSLGSVISATSVIPITGTSSRPAIE